MYTIVVIGGILLIVALIGVAMWCCYRAGAENEYERGLADGRQELADDHAAERKQAGRHAAPREPWPTWSDARNELERRRAARTATVAADLAPVVLPEPGTYLPQAGRDSGPGTVTMAKIPEELSTTGEINIYRARTDDFIARMALDG